MRRAAARSQCANNLRQIALGIHYYADTTPAAPSAGKHLSLFPAGTVPHATLPPEQRLSWAAELLPFLEQDNLYRRLHPQDTWDSAANAPVVQISVKVFHCPDWGREAAPEPAYLTAYLGVAGLGADAATLPAGDRQAGVFGYDRRTALRAVTDGTASTLLILESARANGPWACGGPATVRGLDTQERPYLGTGRPFGGTHFAENSVLGRGKSVGCNAALADGSVRFLAESTAVPVLEALATIAGGEPIPGEW